MEQDIFGLSASIGSAVGLARVMHRVEQGTRIKLTPQLERKALAEAINIAVAEIVALIESQSAAGADVLSFQQAMLQDVALAKDVWPAIEAGISADEAWRTSLDAEIAGFTTSGDEHFAARAADMVDVRDRVLNLLCGVSQTQQLEAGEILVAEDIAPSAFLTMDWSQGGALVLGAGSPYSHVAMLARAQSIPMIVGIGEHWKNLSGQILVNGDEAVVKLNPRSEMIAELKRRDKNTNTKVVFSSNALQQKASTQDGTEIELMINVSNLSDIASFPMHACDGVGLTRTEFLIADILQDEEKQFARYAQLVRLAGGRPVTIRTIDAGGDKPLAGYTVENEINPFMGLRGIRLSLANVDVFKVQLRALLRASALGPINILLPMVSTPADLMNTRRLLSECCAALTQEKCTFGFPDVGIMVEVPAVALSVEQFDANFFSIGTNDLTQYATAASRDNSTVSKYADPLHPGVMFMIEHVAKICKSNNKKVSVCGDAAADPLMIGALLKAGIRSLSVPPSLVAATKAAIGTTQLGQGDHLNA